MKKNSKLFILFALLVVTAMALTACAGEQGPAGPTGEQGPEGPQGPQGEPGVVDTTDLGCTDCHNDGAEMAGIAKEWEESLHNLGEAYVRGTSASCAGCHSSDGFQGRIAEGITNPDTVAEGDTHPVGPDCRACHQIHTSYTGADFALETTDPVEIYAFEGVVYDQGNGNLCANCHQPRRAMEAVDGIVNISSTHWGPHHGPQSTMLLGVGGAGVEGAPSMHYQLVEDGCVSCHMGEGADHTYEPSTNNCVACHADIEDFNIDGAQTAVEEKATELLALMVAAGVWDEEADHVITGEYPEDVAGAIWNYIYVVIEDKSMGVHNSDFALALLQYGIDVFSAGE